MLWQFLLVANAVDMFMWQIPVPLSIEVSNSFLHTGPFFSRLKEHPRQVRNRSETGQKHTIQAILSPLAFQADFSFVSIHIASEVRDIIRACHFRHPGVQGFTEKGASALDWCSRLVL